MKDLSSTDKGLVAWFCLFAFVALIFEPLYYFGCDWHGHSCVGAENNAIVDATRKIWLIYASWDPIFYDIPNWLRVLSCIEVFIFGPLYLVVAIGLWNNSPWLESVALPFCGALVYSTIVYFAMELIENIPNTNYFAVFFVNIPWTIVPILLWLRLRECHNKLKKG